MSDVVAASAGVAAPAESIVIPPLAASLASLGTPSFPRPSASPAVQSALATSVLRADRIAHRNWRRGRPRSLVGLVVESFVAACTFIPYALVALVLRLAIARVFFLSGQAKIEGPRVPLNVQDFDLSVILPLQVKAQTFTLFASKFAAVPVPPMLAAYLVSGAEFLLPILLVLGLATRFAALALLIMTTMIQLYVLPGALWSVHIYWASILLVLLSLGPGQISVDHVIRFLSRR